ncbi:MAG: carbohydrate ABC transporter permease [Opitutaceae bacterium]|nr:carbohydrate ABC transporter permease [Opitutaceae bacterium]
METAAEKSPAPVRASRARASRRQYVIYGLLACAALVFLTPLAWLLATSLKPVEQTMSMPPTWIPRTHSALLDGERVEVSRDYQVTQPGVIAEITAGPEAGRRLLFTDEQAAARQAEIRVLHRVESGWWRVTERSATNIVARTARWDVVPPEAIESRVRFRWENYPKALVALSGKSVEEIEAEARRGASAPAAAAPASDAPGFSTFLGNTLTVCVLGVLGVVFSNALVAYGFARLRWRGRDTFFAITLATMMVPFPVLVVPLYGLFKQLGWIGTLLPLWAPAWFASAFNIFLLRQFFRTIPEELSEAARIDGCSEFAIFWRIILPLSKPALATAALLHFLFAWNDFMGPLLYLTRQKSFTLALALQSYQSQQSGVQWHYLMAASAVTILPIVLLFFFAQKTFIQGIATTGSRS